MFDIPSFNNLGAYKIFEEEYQLIHLLVTHLFVEQLWLYWVCQKYHAHTGGGGGSLRTSQGSPTNYFMCSLLTHCKKNIFQLI